MGEVIRIDEWKAAKEIKELNDYLETRDKTIYFMPMVGVEEEYCNPDASDEEWDEMIDYLNGDDDG